MQLKDRIIVVTGAASGIGKAMAIRFHNEGAEAVICADLSGNAVRAVADEIGGAAYEIDVARESDIQNLIENVENEYGPIDLFCSNAGIALEGGVEVDNDRWAEHMGDQRHGARICSAAPGAPDARTWRRIPA